MSSITVRSRLAVGLEAALAAQAVLLASQLAIGVPPLSGVLADLVLRLLPGALSALILDRLQFLAKPLFLVGLTAVPSRSIWARPGWFRNAWVTCQRMGRSPSFTSRPS